MSERYYSQWDEGIDEAALSWTDRLGLAYCRLNGWEWDDVIGPKPDGFDTLPNYDDSWSFFHRARVTKSDFIRPAIDAILSIIGEANASRCHWKFVLGETEEEWFRWYVRRGSKRKTTV